MLNIAPSMDRLFEILSKQNRCDIIASSRWNFAYPRRMAHSGYAREAAEARHCEFIVDSDVNDSSVTNADVLDAAADTNADWVVPKDYPQDPESTIASIREFQVLYDDHRCNANVMIPLQASDATTDPDMSHAGFFIKHEDLLGDYPRLALGGLNSAGADVQIAATKEMRQRLGDNVLLHGFGFGTSIKLVRAIRRHDQFLDSLDVSTFETAIKNNGLPDRSLSQQEFEFPHGEQSTLIRSQFAASTLYLYNYLLTDYLDDDLYTTSHDRVEDVVQEQMSVTGWNTEEQAAEGEETLG